MYHKPTTQRQQEQQQQQQQQQQQPHGTHPWESASGHELLRPRIHHVDFSGSVHILI
jgi:transcription initiation factor TFIID subunit TAF12